MDKICPIRSSIVDVICTKECAWYLENRDECVMRRIAKIGYIGRE